MQEMQKDKGNTNTSEQQEPFSTKRLQPDGIFVQIHSLHRFLTETQLQLRTLFKQGATLNEKQHSIKQSGMQGVPRRVCRRR